MLTVISGISFYRRSLYRGSTVFPAIPEDLPSIRMLRSRFRSCSKYFRNFPTITEADRRCFGYTRTTFSSVDHISREEMVAIENYRIFLRVTNTIFLSSEYPYTVVYMIYASLFSTELIKV